MAKKIPISDVELNKINSNKKFNFKWIIIIILSPIILVSLYTIIQNCIIYPIQENNEQKEIENIEKEYNTKYSFLKGKTLYYENPNIDNDSLIYKKSSKLTIDNNFDFVYEYQVSGRFYDNEIETKTETGSLYNYDIYVEYNIIKFYLKGDHPNGLGIYTIE